MTVKKINQSNEVNDLDGYGAVPSIELACYRNE